MQTICMIEFNFRGDEKYVISVIEKIKEIARAKNNKHKEIAFLFYNYYWEDEVEREDEDDLDRLYRLYRDRSYFSYDSGGSDSSFSPKDFEDGFESFARRFIEDFVCTFPSCELKGEFSQFTTGCDITEFKYSFYSAIGGTEYSIEWVEEDEYWV